MKQKRFKKNHLIPFTSDYGFKVSFTDEKSLFTRKALQILADLDVPIDRLKMLRNEIEGMTIDSRAGLYDVFCQDQRKRLFIVEMQTGNFEYFKERVLFYIFHLYHSMVKKGDFGFDNILPIFCICIVTEKITDGEAYYKEFKFMDDKFETFYPKIELHLVELDKFPIMRENFNEVKTELEELIYTMKYGHEIDLLKQIEIPPFWKKEWVTDVVSKLDLRNMDADQLMMLEIGVVKLKTIARQQRKELEEAKKLAMIEGKAEETQTRIKLALKKGKLSIEDIAELFETPVENVLKIKKEIEQP